MYKEEKGKVRTMKSYQLQQEVQKISREKEMVNMTVKKSDLLQEIKSLAETHFSKILVHTNIYGAIDEQITEAQVLYDEALLTLTSLMKDRTNVDFSQLYKTMKLSDIEIHRYGGCTPFVVIELLREQLKKCYMMAYIILTEAGY